MEEQAASLEVEGRAEGFLAEGTARRWKGQPCLGKRVPGVRGGEEDGEDVAGWKGREVEVTLWNPVWMPQATESGLCLFRSEEPWKVFELGQECVCVCSCVYICVAGGGGEGEKEEGGRGGLCFKKDVGWQFGPCKDTNGSREAGSQGVAIAQLRDSSILQEGSGHG